MESLEWSRVLGWRLRRQFVEPRPSSAGVVEVAQRLAGVQAQVASAAELCIALRGGRVTELPEALHESRRLVKTWAMRGTLHLLPTAEAPAYLALTATLRNWEKPSWQRTFGATPADLEAMAVAVGEALAGGVELSREELTAAVLDRTGSAHLADELASGWGTLLKPLAWWGVLCYGRPRGTQVTFTAPPWEAMPEVETAARTVIRAYLGAHGPADPATFDRWLTRGTSRKSEVRRWFEALEDELTRVVVEGEEMYALSAHLDELLSTPPADGVHLLGGFDQYVLGAGTSAAYLIPPERRTEVSRAAGWIAPVVVHQGRVAGVWDPDGDGQITITPFEDLPAGPLAEAVERLAAVRAAIA